MQDDPTSANTTQSATPAETESTGSFHSTHAIKPSWALLLGTLGVVYGDIGTSPLYAMRECFYGEFGVEPTPTNVLGVLSLIIWSLIFVVTIKYVFFVLRADNRGEGGILALLASLHPKGSDYSSRVRALILFSGLFGAALLYGDGVITPAISVLSAVEGLNIATKFFEPFVLPLTIIILFAIFWAQSKGTQKIGKIFGPIILVWFLTIGLLGLFAIPSATMVFAALFNPIMGLHWVFTHGIKGFEVMAAVFLVCTGAEALYADMGHFGRPAIQRGWLWIVFPCLILNYLGQGALLLSSEPNTITNPFFQLAPAWAIIPLVILSTAATVIASQALISGAFSLTAQAVQLGYLPRLKILHTSADHEGQIYVPLVNWILLIATIMLVLEFKSSSNLAATYGTAVSLTMLMTTFLMFFVCKKRFKMSHSVSLIAILLLAVVDLVFFSASSVKFFEGGWFPIVLGGLIFTIMTTWYRGRQILAQRITEASVPLESFIKSLPEQEVARVGGTAIYMARDTTNAPMAMVQNIRHNRVVHENVIFLQVVTEERPTVEDDKRIESSLIPGGFHHVKLKYGFMDEPNVPAALIQYRATGAIFDLDRVTFFLGRELVLPTNKPGMALWRERLFSLITTLATRATAYFKIPAEQVVEIGYQVEI